MNKEIFFSIAQIMFFIAAIPLIRRLVKDRYKASKVSFSGSLLTFIGMGLMMIGFLYNEMWIPAILSIPTTGYWALVSISSSGTHKSKINIRVE